MTAFLLTWKEDNWPRAKLLEVIKRFEAEGVVDEPWRLRAHRMAKIGDRVWIFKQGKKPNGIFGVGTVAGASFVADDGAGTRKNFSPIHISDVVDPDRGFLISAEQCARVLTKQQMASRASGCRISDDQSEKLERLFISTSAKAEAFGRLPANMFESVTAEHVWNAVQELLDGRAIEPFAPSIDYDLIVDNGQRLPPKAVFGTAASQALGFSILPGHFSGGLGTPCFRILERSGYEIVPKNAIGPVVVLPENQDDREWAEGSSKLVTHLQRERGKGLSHAKKATFRREHGRLFCERCKADPVKSYGSAVGEACIEVHHRDVHIKDMGADHKTKLSDLQCLCANCHRVVHRELKLLHLPSAAESLPLDLLATPVT